MKGANCPTFCLIRSGKKIGTCKHHESCNSEGDYCTGLGNCCEGFVYGSKEQK